MSSSKYFFSQRWLELGLGVLAAGACACSSGNPTLAPSCTPSASSNTVTAPVASAANVMPVTVDGSLCSGNLNTEYPNEPCVSIQVCSPGGACATINNLLLDTGSYGIRIFNSALVAAGVSSTQIASGGGKLAECVGFGDGSSEFGPVEKFDIVMGGEAKSTNVPILIINDTNIAGFSVPPSACNSVNSTPDTSPSAVGFNGIVGVGLFDQDCGADCTSDSGNGQYYSCTGSGCSGATASMANQVRNPVAALATDNNGVILALPGVPDGGATSLTGSLILGIGTQSNNTASGVQMFPAASDGTFSAVFNPFSADALTSFIDSGSSLLFFPWPPPSNPTFDSTLPDCGGGLSGFYCPASEQSFGVTNIGNGGNPSNCVGFSVANANSQLSGNNMVFGNLAGSAGSDLSSDFDWGLPFFYGRKVYVGITGKAASGLGTGPFWAY